MSQQELQGPEKSDTDAELLEELKKVGSSLAFRQEIRRVLRRVTIVAGIALLASVVAVAALLAVRSYQQTACDRDNRLRKAYIDQWGPILKDSPPPQIPPEGSPPEVVEAYERQVKQRATFEKSLEGFAQHPC